MNNFKLPAPIIIQGAIGLLIIIVVILALKRIGLIQSRDKKKKEIIEQKEATDLIESPYFDINLWEKVNASILMSDDNAKKYANQLWKSFGFFNDNEESIYSVFRSITHKAQISQISFWFTNEHQEDLLGKIDRYMTNTEKAFIMNIINKTKG